MGDHIVIVLTCRAGAHVERIPVQYYDYDGAVALAKILDGSDDCYLESPRDNNLSNIGHCHVCGSLVDATVEHPEAAPEPVS